MICMNISSSIQQAKPFDFLSDDIATFWVALLRLVVNKNTHSKGFQPIVLGEQMTFDLT